MPAQHLLAFAVVARQRAHLVARVQQSAHDMFAYIARGAGDGDAHFLFAHRCHCLRAGAAAASVGQQRVLLESMAALRAKLSAKLLPIDK